MSLIRELRRSYIGRAQRKIMINHRLHRITIRYFSPNYRLLRSVINTWNDKYEIDQILDFPYLTDLFAFAKQEGFFEEIAPNADDWEGEMEPPPPLTEEEARKKEEEEEEQFISEWEARHPGEAPYIHPVSGEIYYFE